MIRAIDKAADCTRNLAADGIFFALGLTHFLAIDNLPSSTEWEKLTVDQRKLALADWIRAEIYAHTGIAHGGGGD